MTTYLRDWFRNLVVGGLIVIVVGVLTLIFVHIFYPETLGILALTAQTSVGLITALKFWPIAVVIVIVGAMPRRRR